MNVTHDCMHTGFMQVLNEAHWEQSSYTYCAHCVARTGVSNLSTFLHSCVCSVKSCIDIHTCHHLQNAYNAHYMVYLYIQSTLVVVTAAIDGLIWSPGAGCVTSAPITITGLFCKRWNLQGGNRRVSQNCMSDTASNDYSTRSLNICLAWELLVSSKTC